LVRAPQLFGAVVCEVPLLDMKRYSHLLAGASWMAEYGDPDDPEQWKTLQTISPYHQVKPPNEVQYPPTLFTTSTRDDRVHPAHARKMVHKMKALGHPQVLYYENVEGGHAGAADNKQTAFMELLASRFLEKVLGGREENGIGKL
jgi:prolyl oligopeptidase